MTRLMPLFGMNPRKYGRNKDVDLMALTEYHFPTHVKIDIRPVAEIKRKAGECHASQGFVQMRRGIMGIASRFFGDHEHYMRAFPPSNGNSKVVNDLFINLEDG